MKVFQNSTTTLTLVAIVALATLGSGCDYINKVLAKDKLNQGAIEYNKGNNKNAQEFFKDASEIDPNNPITWLYLGATLVKDYKKEIDEGKKKVIADQALGVYEKALSLANENCVVIDNALSYMVVIHEDMKNTEDRRKKMEERAEHQCTKKEAKAQSYYGIGVDYWKCSYDQTNRYQDQALAASQPFHYRKMDYSPEALADKAKATACVEKGFQYFDKALQIDNEYTEPMFYKGLLYRELQKLTKEEPKRKQYEQMANQISKEATDLQNKKQAAAAEQKAQEQTAPTS
jgi:hypothetical protein